eukprot:1178933-Prorocentrum_minimum.AAC.1
MCACSAGQHLTPCTSSGLRPHQLRTPGASLIKKRAEGHSPPAAHRTCGRRSEWNAGEPHVYPCASARQPPLICPKQAPPSPERRARLSASERLDPAAAHAASRLFVRRETNASG